MFNKFTRSCAQSDVLEKGSALHSPLFRFFSFAVCLALMLGIFALIPFPASAESDGLVIDGKNCATINGYPIIGANHFNNASLCAVRDKYTQCSIFLVCSYNGDFYIPVSSSVPQLNIHGSNGDYIYSYGFGSDGDYSLCPYTTNNANYEPWLEKICADVVSSSNSVSVSFRSKSKNISLLYDFNGNDVSDSINPTDCTYYWAVNPYFVWTSSSGYMKRSHLISSSDGSGFVSASSLPEADFVQFPVRDDNQFYMIDWISDGYQYPIFDFWINDKNNLHTYSLKFSSNSSFAQDLYDQEQQKGFNQIGYKYYSIANYLKLIGQNSIYDLQWDYVWSLSDSNLQFTNSNMKAFSINLSDYFSITKFLVYRCQIVDNNTGSIIATTYFTTNRNFNKSNSGYGSNVYEYTNKDNLITDTTNNNGYSNGYINADTSTSGNTFESDNANDIVHTYDPTNLDIDISSIFGVLNQSTQGIGSFFQACFNVIPAAVLSILTAAVALLVILRILGR